MRSLQLRTAILDLRRAKPAPVASRVERALEAEEAARIWVWPGGGARHPDGRVENTWDNRIKIVRKLRQLRPRL